ncbi:uncharacterized protein Aud_009998 [Aspergillus udagawae]|uniref:Uncharacterized protein n=1 Tax=Aspergillus udagawae TaxID=91492 RepID=A0A8E0R045_9EURO|nr:uncharacterized protein Aud_009998 [Aspergillus udagawae]GIC93510.1 hypothetical protein Aud_009998 [Aspergillus udagawae]
MTGDGEGRRDGSWTSAIHYCQCLGAKPPWASQSGDSTPDQIFPSNAELIHHSHLPTTEQSACSRMSGPGEERWRGGRPYDQNRQSGQRHSNSRNMGAHSGNRGGQSSAPWTDSREPLATGPSQEQHVPVRGFNAAELKAALRREPKPFFYRPSGKDANNNRASGPWGTKPNTMANGKDFFLELRKQVTALRQGATVPGG